MNESKRRISMFEQLTDHQKDQVIYSYNAPISAESKMQFVYFVDDQGNVNHRKNIVMMENSELIQLIKEVVSENLALKVLAN